MTPDQRWFFPHGSLARGEWLSVVDDAIPGWRHTGLRVADLRPDAPVTLAAGSVERLVVPLTGDVRVSYDGDRGSVEMAGRQSVFDGPADVLYLPVGFDATLTGSGRIAIAEAPATRTYPARHIRAGEVPIEVRGTGDCTREVRNVGTPDALAADRLIVCEVVTPAGGWSSYPPHKHDTDLPGRESRLEEIYYFETQVADGEVAPAGAQPFGLFTAYPSDARPISISAQVRTGDIALIPYGFHGPAAAVPGYDLYYLNVMAGPDPDRAWLITDDPAHGWIRSTWAGQAADPRVPARRSRGARA